MKRNILLFIILIVVSLLSTMFFGGIISRYIFPFGGNWIVPQEIISFTNSFPFLYFFFSPFIFLIWGKNRKKTWIIGSVMPLFIIDLYMETYKSVWFWSAIFFAAGIIIASVINFSLKHLRNTNPPIVIK